MTFDRLMFGLLGFVFLYQLIRFKGLVGAKFGARVVGTVGEVEFGQRGMAGSKLRVVRLDGPKNEEPTIGIVGVAPFLAPYAISPFSLTQQQAKVLAHLLVTASEGDPS